MQSRQTITFRCFALLPLMILLSSAALAQQTRPIEDILTENSWLKTHHYILRLTSSSSGAVGELWLLEDKSAHKYAATSCFENMPSSKGGRDVVFTETSKISTSNWVSDTLGWIKVKIDFPRPTKEAGGGWRPNIEVSLNPNKNASRITATLSFTGTREQVDSRTLLNYMLKSHWSDECLSALRSKDSFVVTDIIRGALKLRFSQVVDAGKPEAIEYVLPSDWTKTGQGKDVGYETEAILVIARHLKITTNGSRVTKMLATKTYLLTPD